MFLFSSSFVCMDKNHDKPEAVAGTQGEQNYGAAGGLNATEVNAGRSVAK